MACILSPRHHFGIFMIRPEKIYKTIHLSDSIRHQTYQYQIIHTNPVHYRLIDAYSRAFVIQVL
jgi:hypothetical protein